MQKKENKMHLPTIDSLFTTQEERDNNNLEKIVNLAITEIDDFPEHPFKVDVNDEMKEIVDSIKDKGVLVPAIVRKKDNGRYELISGHRRKKASEILNLATIPCIVRDLTDEEATIIMVDSNLQREKILPSEKAFAYKMRKEAVKHQGKRNDLTSSPMATKLKANSAQMIGEKFGDCKDTVYRLIRLTYLIPELLNMVDNEALKISPGIAVRPAAEISFLTKDEQKHLLNLIEFNACTPSWEQAIKLKNKSQAGTLTINEMENIMIQQKPNQTPKLKVSMNRLSNVLPNSLKNDKEREEYVINAVIFYDKYRKKLKERNLQER